MTFFKFIQEIQKTNDPEWNYYRTNISVNPLVTPERCAQFILEYFLNGEKGFAVFELNEQDGFALTPSFRSYKCYSETNICPPNFSEYRAVHTVSAFFLGVFLECCLTRGKGGGVEILAGNRFFPFSYLWFLTCLYHDYGYIVEENWRPPRRLSDKPSVSPKDGFFQLKGMMNRMRITYSPYQQVNPLWRGSTGGRQTSERLFEFLLQHSSSLKEGLHFDCGAEVLDFRYPQSLIMKYFSYGLHELQPPVYNHGIIGGYLLFDRLLKGYASAYMHSHPNQTEDYPDIKDFSWRGKAFSIEQIPLFAHIADCIIAHNIWKADAAAEAKYRECGLGKLVGDNFKKIRFQENPLLFILSVVDTIEPYKIYGLPSAMGRDALRIWKSIDLSFQNNILTVASRYKCRPIEKMYQKAKGLKSWVDITDVIVGNDGKSLSIKF